MKSLHSTTLPALAALLFTLGLTDAASAASGVVSGRLMFFNNQGNYCPNTRNCTHARYTQSQFRVNLPVRDVKVYLVDHNDNVIGQGVTNTQGYYKISWNTPFAYNWGRIHFYGEHKDGRFKLRTSGGGRWVFWGQPLWYLTPGTSSSSPQDVGWLTWGNSTSPNALVNLYDGAWRMWYEALRYSGLMLSRFTNVQIRAYDAAACPTSCANGADKRIIIDSVASAFSPQARVMHEMGHVASYQSNPRRGLVDYNFDSDPGWTFTEQEWQASAFEEAIATFFGDVAIYWFANPEPRSCLSQGVCFTNIETSMGSPTTCGAAPRRWPLSSMRFLRDLYDNSNEWLDNVSEPYYEFFDTLARYPAGYGNRQDSEPWRQRTFLGIPIGLEVDDKDGLSSVDFREHFEAETGANAAFEHYYNCSPLGD